MGITYTSVMRGTDIDGGSTATSTSITPTSNALQLLTVVQNNGLSTTPTTPTATGCGLTWVVVDTVEYDSGDPSRKRITLFRALGASPSSGTISLDFGGQNQSIVNWVLDEVTGIDTGGTNGSAAVVQYAHNKDEGSANNYLIVTLGTFSDAANETYGVFSYNNQNLTLYAVGSGFSLVNLIDDSSSPTTTDLAIVTEKQAANDTTVDITWGYTGWNSGGIAIELKPAGTGIYRPSSDITDTGWVNSTGTDSFALINEVSYNDADYITSPALGTGAGITMGLSGSLAAGTYTVRVRAKYSQTSGQIKITLLNDSNVSQGASSWQTLSASLTTYSLTVTTSGTATRVKIEVQA